MRTHSYPAWFYGPNGESRVFQREGDVPAGWHDHPSKQVTAEKTGAKPLPPKTDELPGSQTGTKPVVAANAATGEQTGGKSAETRDVSNTLDRDGWPWDAALHAATQSLTKENLWRMKVGVSRPAPKPGFPKPVLDL